jgi:LysM repeat protein
MTTRYNIGMRKLAVISILAGLLFALWGMPAHVQARIPALQSEIPSPYELIDSVNALRTSSGLAAYEPNIILMQVAQNHADYMYAAGTTTHYGAGGLRPFERALAAGYAVAGDLSQGGFISENIYHGYNITVADVMDWWYNSPPHYGTMMSTTLRDIGAGIAGADGDYYYTIIAGLSTGSSPAVLPTGSGITSTPASGTRAPTPFTTVTVYPNTPEANGAVYHIVQSGETLWLIALAYGVTADDITTLNPQMGSFIYPGDTLMIRPGFTPTPTAPTFTPTLRPTATYFPTSTPTRATTLTPTPDLEAAVPASTGAGITGGIILGALLIAGLITFLGARGRK